MDMSVRKSSLLCVAVSLLYSVFNGTILIKIVPHCKGCSLDKTALVDANEITLVFFIIFYVVSLLPFIFPIAKVKEKRKQLVAVGIINGFLCFVGINLNIWA